MGAEGLEPSRLSLANGFSFSRSFRCCHLVLRIGLSLYPRLYVRVAPVESLHLPEERSLFRLGSGLPCLSPDLGFPEFESIHLGDLSLKAQFSKSVASTIPPRPRSFTLIARYAYSLYMSRSRSSHLTFCLFKDWELLKDPLFDFVLEATSIIWERSPAFNGIAETLSAILGKMSTTLPIFFSYLTFSNPDSRQFCPQPKFLTAAFHKDRLYLRSLQNKAYIPL